MSNRYFLHVDLDAFFASVEQLDHPEYRGKPVIVGGLPGEKRSVVSTASYEARAFGVLSAMPVSQAYRLCPQGIFVHGRMKRYAELSYQIMTIFKNYSPDIEQMSIDEAFIDLTGTEKLFGPPEETARKLKQEVKEKTGLTVSVGLASTKYIAKIASGLSKPDGFFVVPAGEEETFMLNLPLSKVWGLGKKSLEALKNRGLFTTKDIHALPVENLQVMFGNSMGSFLYDAVRGCEKESFNRKTKNHSISAETTFVEDISDIYTAETQLLELCQGVMFRLLKEKCSSKTVMLKMRYNDFTTFTVQETHESPVSSVDDMYTIIKKLFEKKYVSGRGIRLLGVGFENVDFEEGPLQQSLFEDKKAEKKKKVEQAILKMKLKNPDINIQKARTLKSLLLLWGFLTFFSYRQNAFSQETGQTVINQGAGSIITQTMEEPEDDIEGTLFEWDINDRNHVDFSVEGFWKGEFSGGATGSWSNDSAFAVSGNVPVYKQEVQISAMFMLNNHWYFSGDFADSFTRNTLAVGYTGNGFVRSVRISNRGITMPYSYSADFFGYGLGGGENQAPGISANFRSPDEKHSWDAMVRYDATSAKSATFYGTAAVNDMQISLADFMYGKAFVFPEDSAENLQDIKDIYVENKNGAYTDSRGRKYKKISRSEYAVIYEKQAILFSQAAGTSRQDSAIPSILVTFYSQNTAGSVISKAGSYDDENSFAGKIQSVFNQAKNPYKLSDFSYALSTVIENQDALIIQNYAGFSPFMRANVYDCGFISDADLLIISKSTEQENTRYVAEEFGESAFVSYQDFFTEERLYATVRDKENSFFPGTYWPFATILPEIYLNLSYESDLELLARTYTSNDSLYIGTKAVSGTIRVYKNGNLVQASYDSASGTIELSSAISETDTIYVTWQEESADFSSGSLAAGLGYNVQISPHIQADAALTTRIPVTFQDTMVTTETVQQGFAALSGGIRYETENLLITQKAAGAVQKANATDSLLVCAQETGTAQTYYLGSESGYSVQSTPPDCDESKDGTVRNFLGVQDSSITGYKIPLRWDFSTEDSLQGTEGFWAAADIKLENGNLLKNSSQLELALQADIPSSQGIDGYELFIQLGVHVSNEKYGEDTESLPVWKITDFDFSKKTWQVMTITLSDAQRAKLVSYHDMRVIVKGKSGEKGTLYIGPYSPVLQSIYTSYDGTYIVTTRSTAKTSSSYASQISWIAAEEDSAYKENPITAVSYFSEADFSPYKAVRFEFALSAAKSQATAVESGSPALEYILDAQAASAAEDGVTALRVSINDYSKWTGDAVSFHVLEVDLENQYVSVDGETLGTEDYELFIDKNVIPTRQKITISPLSGQYFYTNASFFVYNLTYHHTDVTFSASHYISAQYKAEKVLNINDYDLLKDAHIKISSLQNADANAFSVKSDAEGGITVAGVRVEADISAKKLDFYKAGHKITSEEPVFKVISLQESYRFNREENSLSKKDDFLLDFSALNVPISLSANATATHKSAVQTQKAESSLKIAVPISTASLSFAAHTSFLQKINLSKNEILGEIQSNYFTSYKDISSVQFSYGDSLASKRTALYDASLKADLPYFHTAPELAYSLSSEYTNATGTVFADTTKLNFTLPFSFRLFSLAFSATKTAEGEDDYQKPAENGSYLEDTALFFELQPERTWFYTSAPIYDLFDKSLPQKVSATYSSQYEIEMNRKLFNSLKDLYIPSSAKFSAMRTVSNQSTYADVYQLKSVITNASINNLGSTSKNKFFTWFRQEELYSSLTGIAKIPTDVPENTNFIISYYIQSLFFITEQKFITAAADFSWETDNVWNARGSFIYNRPGNTSLSYVLAHLFFPNFTKDKAAITIKDSLNVEVGNADNSCHQKYEINHSAELEFLKFFTITTGLGLSYGQKITSSLTSNTLALTATVGAKAEF